MKNEEQGKIMMKNGGGQSGWKGGVKKGWRRSNGKKVGKEEKESNNDRREAKKNEKWKKGGNESNMEVKVKKSKKTVEIVNKCPVTVLCTFVEVPLSQKCVPPRSAGYEEMR